MGRIARWFGVSERLFLSGYVRGTQPLIKDEKGDTILHV
jgi:hypothetical protein